MSETLRNTSKQHDFQEQNMICKFNVPKFWPKFNHFSFVLFFSQECASRAARDITDPDDLIIWGCAGCLGQMDVDPNPSKYEYNKNGLTHQPPGRYGSYSKF